MASDSYQQLFPETVLRRASQMELEIAAGGGRLLTSAGGVLTRRGADVIIIDDPIKADDAMSPTALSQTTDWTCATLFTRLNDKKRGAVIL